MYSFHSSYILANVLLKQDHRSKSVYYAWLSDNIVAYVTYTYGVVGNHKWKGVLCSK